MRLSDFRGLERRIGPNGAGDALGAKTLGNVHAAMIGGQDDRIVDALRIQHLEEAGEVAVERQQLQAHLLAAGAEAVADVIGCGKPDRQNVRSRVGSELQLLHETRGDREHRAVIFGRRAERAHVAGGSTEAPCAHGQRRRNGIWRRLALAERWGLKRRPRRGKHARKGGIGPSDRCRDQRRLVVGRKASCRSSTSAGRPCARPS